MDGQGTSDPIHRMASISQGEGVVIRVALESRRHPAAHAEDRKLGAALAALDNKRLHSTCIVNYRRRQAGYGTVAKDQRPANGVGRIIHTERRSAGAI